MDCQECVQGFTDYRNKCLEKSDEFTFGDIADFILKKDHENLFKEYEYLLYTYVDINKKLHLHKKSPNPPISTYLTFILYYHIQWTRGATVRSPHFNFQLISPNGWDFGQYYERFVFLDEHKRILPTDDLVIGLIMASYFSSMETYLKDCLTITKIEKSALKTLNLFQKKFRQKFSD